MARAQKPARTVRAYYPGLCITCGGIFEAGATIYLNVPGKTGKGHADCALAPKFVMTAEANGVALYEFTDAKTFDEAARNRRYLVTTSQHGTKRIEAVRPQDEALVVTLKGGKLRAPEKGEAHARAHWPQFCRVCDGIIDINEPLYYRRREDAARGPRQKARHQLPCSPLDWRLTKNSAGSWYQDLRPGGKLWHLPKRARSGLVEVKDKTVEGATLDIIDREVDRKLQKVHIENHANLTRINDAVKFVGEAVPEVREPRIDDEEPGDPPDWPAPGSF